MQTLVVCIYFLFYLTQNYLLQQALNAGGVACHAATTGCALTSPPIPKHSTILLQGATHLFAISVSCVVLSSQMSVMLIISMPHVVFLDTVLNKLIFSLFWLPKHGLSKPCPHL